MLQTACHTRHNRQCSTIVQNTSQQRKSYFIQFNFVLFNSMRIFYSNTIATSIPGLLAFFEHRERRNPGIEVDKIADLWWSTIIFVLIRSAQSTESTSLKILNEQNNQLQDRWLNTFLYQNYFSDCFLILAYLVRVVAIKITVFENNLEMIFLEILRLKVINELLYI